MNKKIRIQINNDSVLPGKKAGDTVEVETRGNGIPDDPFWRARLKDARIDNCIEILGEKKPNKGKSVKIVEKKEEKKGMNHDDNIESSS